MPQLNSPISTCANCGQQARWLTAITNDGSYLAKINSCEPHVCKIKASTTVLKKPFICKNQRCAGSVQWAKKSQYYELRSFYDGKMEADLHNCQFIKGALLEMTPWEVSMRQNSY